MRVPRCAAVEEYRSDAEREQNQLEAIEYQHMFKVDKRYADADRAGKHCDARIRDALFPKKHRAAQPQHSVQNLNGGVPKRDRLLAAAAPPAENAVRQNRNIVIPFELVAALRAMRCGRRNAHFIGHAVNHNIEKATDAKPHKPGEYINKQHVDIQSCSP